MGSPALTPMPTENDRSMITLRDDESFFSTDMKGLTCNQPLKGRTVKGPKMAPNLTFFKELPNGFRLIESTWVIYTGGHSAIRGGDCVISASWYPGSK